MRARGTLVTVAGDSEVIASLATVCVWLME